MPNTTQTFPLGTLTNSRRRLWRVDAQDGKVLYFIKDVIADALNRAHIGKHANDLVETRRKSPAEECRSLQIKLTTSETPWLKGSDEIPIGSWDLLAVKVLWVV